MNYQNIYNQLITRGQSRVIDGYSERHHIIPRCMGGKDDTLNLVNLTPEEHYVAHQLLIRIYPNNHKLIYAAKMMTIGATTHKRKSNKLYSWLRQRFADAISIDNTGKILSKETREKISKANVGNSKHLGKSHTQESKDKISNKKKGVIPSNEAKINHLNAMEKRKGIPLNRHNYIVTEETKKKLSDSVKASWIKRKGLAHAANL